ncbi:MAG: hypothetical protein U5K27_12525 [Desulfotignum sp.]|nr:hypothetical protein [Desulfotignum sp.]
MINDKYFFPLTTIKIRVRIINDADQDEHKPDETAIHAEHPRHISTALLSVPVSGTHEIFWPVSFLDLPRLFWQI